MSLFSYADGSRLQGTLYPRPAPLCPAATVDPSRVLATPPRGTRGMLLALLVVSFLLLLLLCLSDSLLLSVLPTVAADVSAEHLAAERRTREH